MHTHSISRTGRRRTRRTVSLATAAALTLVGGAVITWSPGVSSGDGHTGTAAPDIPFERYRLDNGLEVLLHQDNRVPVVAVSVWYHVGSGNEVPGRSGFAHLFEHMLFQGSKHVGEDRHFGILRNIGATAVNGTTNTDRTNYFEVVPSHHLETALWLESDRMGYLLPLVTQKSLDNQIEVVRNERRQGIDNQPYGTTREAMYKMMFPEGHPYRHMVIGLHADLDAATLDDVKTFYKRWYVPANATLALAGDFDKAGAKKLIDKWFGSFPKSEDPKTQVMPLPVVKRSRIEIPDKLAKLEMVSYVWHTPAFFAEGDAEFDLLAHALADGGTGRLYRILVHDKQLAQSVSAFQASMGFSSLFQVRVQLKTGADRAVVERIVNEEIERVRREPISGAEMARAVANFESGFVWGLEGLLSRAEVLQRYNHYVGDPGYVAKDMARYTNSTPQRVLEYAQKYLAPERRGELITVPAGK